MDVPLIEQVKIQARILVPLVKALQAELGEERANEIVRKALGSLYRKYGETWWRSQAFIGPQASHTARPWFSADLAPMPLALGVNRRPATSDL